MVDVKGYEGLYAVTEDGQVWSYTTKNFKTLSKNHNGYLRVGLSKNGKLKTVSVHRLVAEAYIENPNNLPQVDHIDGNKEHNSVDNLRWCTHKENCEYASENGLVAKSNGIRRVHCVENGRVYEDCADAARDLGLCRRLIWEVCNGKQHTTGGYHFTYVD